MIKVILPVLPDLGYEDLQRSDCAAEQMLRGSPSPDSVGSDTVVQSKRCAMIEGPDQTLFRFTDSVSVSGTNLNAHLWAPRCDCVRQSGRLAVNRRLARCETIEAFDDVEFKQTGRVATGDKATILPNDGKVVLEGNAVVTMKRESLWSSDDIIAGQAACNRRRRSSDWQACHGDFARNEASR